MPFRRCLKVKACLLHWLLVYNILRTVRNYRHPQVQIVAYSRGLALFVEQNGRIGANGYVLGIRTQAVEGDVDVQRATGHLEHDLIWKDGQAEWEAGMRGEWEMSAHTWHGMTTPGFWGKLVKEPRPEKVEIVLSRQGAQLYSEECKKYFVKCDSTYCS